MSARAPPRGPRRSSCATSARSPGAAAAHRDQPRSAPAACRRRPARGRPQASARPRRPAAVAAPWRSARRPARRPRARSRDPPESPPPALRGPDAAHAASADTRCARPGRPCATIIQRRTWCARAASSSSSDASGSRTRTHRLIIPAWVSSFGSATAIDLKRERIVRIRRIDRRDGGIETLSTVKLAHAGPPRIGRSKGIADLACGLFARSLGAGSSPR